MKQRKGVERELQTGYGKIEIQDCTQARSFADVVLKAVIPCIHVIC